MYRYESSKTSDRPKSSHIAAKTAEKNVAVPISNQFALSRNITQMQSFDSDPDELHSKLTKRISSRRNNGLPAQLQNGIENLSGYSMDNVRVHYNSPRPAGLNALAYAKGEDIYVAPGQEKHLPHEAWHIVQQKQGRAVPTGRLNGVDINDNPALEHEADVMGAKAVQLRFAECNDVLQLRKTQESAAQLEPKPYSLNSKIYNSDKIKAHEKIFAEIKDIIENTTLMPDNKGFALKVQKIPEEEFICIWKNIKNAFSTIKNINTIIYKIFRGVEYSKEEEKNFRDAVDALTRKYNERDNEKPALWTELLNDLRVTIGETLNDIFYWNCTRKRHPQSFLGKTFNFFVSGSVCKKIDEIVVTNSDIHTRGVGVCRIDFDDQEKLMIKPDKRNFEKIVYGKSDGEKKSLASDFNSITNSSKDNVVGELKIETSSLHGSAVEYFPHKQFPEMKDEEKKLINTAALINEIIFSSMLGLADLHYENMVYKDNKVQLIDAEVGLKYLLDSNKPLSSAINSGEMVVLSGRSIPEDEKLEKEFTKYYNKPFMQKMIDFLDKAVKPKLKDQRCRIVPIETTVLYAWRSKINGYQGLADRTIAYDLYCDCFSQYFDRGYKEKKLGNLKRAYNCMIYDFKKGRIPFFEFDFNTGDIIQKYSGGEIVILSDHIDGMLITSQNNAEAMIQKNINILKDIMKNLP